MHFSLEKNIDCSNIESHLCHEAIVNELIANGFPLFDITNDKIFGHVSIYHEKNKHQIWIFYYDTDGMAESVSYDWEKKQNGKTYEKERTVSATITGTGSDGKPLPLLEEQGANERIILQPYDKVFKSPKPTETQINSAIENILTATKKLKPSKITEAKESIVAKTLLKKSFNSNRGVI